MLLELIVYLCDNYGKSELVTQLVDSTRIHIIPTMNPDGYRNAMELKTGNGRHNGKNVDLNRNFPSIFTKTEDEIQPETAAVMSWSKIYPFVLSANLHGGSLVVNYPYDDNQKHLIDKSPSPDEPTFIMISKAYSKVNFQSDSKIVEGL